MRRHRAIDASVLRGRLPEARGLAEGTRPGDQRSSRRWGNSWCEVQLTAQPAGSRGDVDPGQHCRGSEPKQRARFWPVPPLRPQLCHRARVPSDPRPRYPRSPKQNLHTTGNSGGRSAENALWAIDLCLEDERTMNGLPVLSPAARSFWLPAIGPSVAVSF